MVTKITAQSFEAMPGTERVFIDIQWLRTFDEMNQWSFFSRTRATLDYAEKTDIFSGAYLNYTTPIGLGGTIVGRISNQGAGSDTGVHYFKASQRFMVFALVSTGLSSELNYSWFSIMRFTPSLNENWNLFSGLELFSSFNREGHTFSVQRIRIGLSRIGYQFGVGLNLTGIGKPYDTIDVNPGFFVRKQF